MDVKAQKPIRVKATETYRANKNETTADAERISLERAKIKALQEVFGENISESSSGIVSTQFDENFYSSYSNTSVKGEWIETIGEPVFEYSFDDRMPIVTCTVEGLVKEIQGIRAEYEAVVLKHSPNKKFASNDFSDGDEMFLYFKSPVSGFINVFLVCRDDDNALCLLPYRESKEGSFKVNADTEYYLFSKEAAPSGQDDLVDEYILSSDRQREFDDIVVIFSPEEFNKVGLNVKKDDLEAIKETSIKKFNDWLAKLRSHHNNITVKNYPITISKQ